MQIIALISNFDVAADSCKNGLEAQRAQPNGEFLGTPLSHALVHQAADGCAGTGVFAVLATMAIAGFLVYRIVKPSAPATKSICRVFPGGRMRCSFQCQEWSRRGEGWFFPGFRGASTINSLPRIWVEQGRAVDAGFRVARSPVQRFCV